ncbi:hypothetical protein SSCG_02301 [Streptomyces clavuligerus]|nr:hypothetical protein SSCG_02301 [Streptomyces clavuligerus]
MKLISPAATQLYRTSATDCDWSDPGEILAIATEKAFVGLGSRHYTTPSRVAALAQPRRGHRQDDPTPHPGAASTRPE